MDKYQKLKATKVLVYFMCDRCVKYHISEEACVATLAGHLLDLFAIM